MTGSGSLGGVPTRGGSDNYGAWHGNRKRMGQIERTRLEEGKCYYVPAHKEREEAEEDRFVYTKQRDAKFVLVFSEPGNVQEGLAAGQHLALADGKRGQMLRFVPGLHSIMVGLAVGVEVAAVAWVAAVLLP